MAPINTHYLDPRQLVKSALITMDADFSVSRRCFFEKFRKAVVIYMRVGTTCTNRSKRKERYCISSALLIGLIAKIRPNWIKTSLRWGKWSTVFCYNMCMRARYLRINNILPLLDRIWEYVIHFMITINAIAFLKCVFVLLHSGLPFSGLPVSCLDFLVCLFHVGHFPKCVLFPSAIFRSAIFCHMWHCLRHPLKHRLVSDTRSDRHTTKVYCGSIAPRGKNWILLFVGVNETLTDCQNSFPRIQQ